MQETIIAMGLHSYAVILLRRHQHLPRLELLDVGEKRLGACDIAGELKFFARDGIHLEIPDLLTHPLRIVTEQEALFDASIEQRLGADVIDRRADAPRRLLGPSIEAVEAEQDGGERVDRNRRTEMACQAIGINRFAVQIGLPFERKARRADRLSPGCVVELNRKNGHQ